MRFTISREALLEALAAVLPVVKDKSPMPIVTHCLIEATESGVRFTGTDLDHWIAADAAADVSEAGSVTLPAKRLAEIAAKLPPVPVEFAEKAARVTLKCGSARFNLVGMAPAEYPHIPSIPLEPLCRVRTEDVRVLIRQTAFAASREESRPILGGVLWELNPNAMRMVATDGVRLAKVDCPAEGKQVSSKFIVPPWALEQLVRLFSADDEIGISAGDNHQLAFRSPAKVLVTRLVEGPYPNYDQVIPRDNDRIALLDRATFASAVERVLTVVALTELHRVRLSFDAREVQLTSRTSDVGDASEQCAVNYTGEPLVIGLNAKHLLEIVKRIPGDEIKMTFKAPERGAVIEPSGNGHVAGAHLYVLMPLRDPG